MKLKINEAGSILIEAMAMLGLIAMVTPILYKKAAERTTEIRDINAASEMRGLIKAVDDYLKDNYELIIRGDEIVLDSQITVPSGAEYVNWSDFKAPDIGEGEPQYAEYSKKVPIEHFAEYLPYGFLDENGDAIGSRTFKNYEVVIKKVDSGALGEDKVAKQVLTGFVRGVPAEPDFAMMRASRIASMIGSNGGYGLDAGGGEIGVMGSQGIWGIEKPSTDLGMTVGEGDIVTASVQSISSGAGDYEGVLYRVYRKERRLNTMSTTLMMGDQSIKGTNQMIIHASGEDFKPENPEKMNQANALLLFNKSDDLKPGARIEGRIAAAVTGMKFIEQPQIDKDAYTIETPEESTEFRERFLVDEDSNTTIDATFKASLLTEPGVNAADATENPGMPNRSIDKYNLEVEKEDVRIENERMNVGEVLKIFPVDAGAEREKTAKLDRTKALDDPARYSIHDPTDNSNEEQKDANDQTRVKIEAESGVVIDSKVEGGLYGGETHLDITSKGVVGATDGSINFLTGESIEELDEGNIEAGLQLGGTNVPGELGYETNLGSGAKTGLAKAELFGRDVVNIGTIQDVDLREKDSSSVGDYYPDLRDNDTNSEREMIRIGDGASQLSMTVYYDEGNTIDRSEAKLESDFVDIITTNYVNEGYNAPIDQPYDDIDRRFGSRISMRQSPRTVNGILDWAEIYAHSDMIHLHARKELHLETDEDLRLTADHIYNEFEGPLDKDASVGGGSYHIAVLPPRDGSVNPAEWRYETLYMDQGVTRMANRNQIALQADRVNIGNYGASNKLNPDQNSFDDIHAQTPVVSIHGDAAGFTRYGSEDADVDGHNTMENEVINIRRGIIEMSRNRVETDDEKQDPRSYIRADRLVANEPLDTAVALPNHGVVPEEEGWYDAYQVNPAYTSVMHDIKLTTRGGARLSDILPDFINKGIYVVDTTYTEQVNNWEEFNITEEEIRTGEFKDVIKYKKDHIIKEGEVIEHGYTIDHAVSPWAGFVPKPQCPPGYARVITVTPAGLAMAQAGVPLNKNTMHGQRTADLGYPTDIPRDPFETYSAENGYAMDPLFFQKSTWFRAKAHPHYKGSGSEPKDFQGWSVILGFIYPTAYYKTYFEGGYFKELLNKSGKDRMEGILPEQWQSDFSVVWNLFPVYRKELEAYATVYCYFDRTSVIYRAGDNGPSLGYVDPYDQLGNYRMDDEKDSLYKDRLNDPTLKYTDPW